MAIIAVSYEGVATRISIPPEWFMTDTAASRVVDLFVREYEAEHGPLTNAVELTGGPYRWISDLPSEIQVRSAVKTYRVDMAGTIYEGVAYLDSGWPPVIARHATVIRGTLEGGYVRVVEAADPKRVGQLLPTFHTGTQTLYEVDDDTPLHNGRPRSPVHKAPLSPTTQAKWDRFWEEEQNRPESYYQETKDRVHKAAREAAEKRKAGIVDDDVGDLGDFDVRE